MKAAPRTMAVALALLGACVRPPAQARRDLHPPAPPVRAGAPLRGAGPGPGFQARTPPRAPADAAGRAVAAAQALVGERAVVVGGNDYGQGCAALVRAALDAAGRPLPKDARDAAAIHALASSRGALRPLARAAPGDVVFLAEKPGGAPVHVGVLARREDDGTAIVLHRTARGVLPLRVSTGAARGDALLVRGRAVPAGSLALGAADLIRG